VCGVLMVRTHTQIQTTTPIDGSNCGAQTMRSTHTMVEIKMLSMRLENRHSRTSTCSGPEVVTSKVSYASFDKRS